MGRTPYCCNCAAAVALCTAATLRAAATAADAAAAAVPPPSFRQCRAGALPQPPTLRCRAAATTADAATAAFRQVSTYQERTQHETQPNNSSHTSNKMSHATPTQVAFFSLHGQCTSVAPKSSHCRSQVCTGHEQPGLHLLALVDWFSS